MKTILLMSCALCAGMNGYGNGMGIQEISLENNDVSKRKIQDGRIVTNSSSPKRIKKATGAPTALRPPQEKGLDVVRSPYVVGRRESCDSFMQNLEAEVGLLLESEAKFDDSRIGMEIRKIFQNHPDKTYDYIFQTLVSILEEKSSHDSSAGRIRALMDDGSFLFRPSWGG